MHISQLCDKFIKHPIEAVAVGDIVKVRVIGIDKAREQAFVDIGWLYLYIQLNRDKSLLGPIRVITSTSQNTISPFSARSAPERRFTRFQTDSFRLQKACFYLITQSPIISILLRFTRLPIIGKKTVADKTTDRRNFT